MIYWLVAGVVLFLTEIGMPGVGLMFAGCGALTVGLLLNFSFIALDDTLLQAVIFFASTPLWALLLWKPIQKCKLGKSKAIYRNIIGEIATVGTKGVNKASGGEVSWSGTIMKAKLAENSNVEKLESGATVVVKDVVGNTLIVTPQI